MIVEVTKYIALPAAADIPFATALSISSQVSTALPAICGCLKRAISYKLNTLACTLALVAPSVTLLSLLPSILIGLASRVFTNTGTTSPASTKVLAYINGTPGVISLGLMPHVIALRTGISQLAANIAAAVLKPIYFKKSRRGVCASMIPVVSSNGKDSRNSFASVSLTACVGLICSNPCQYCFLLIVYFV